MTSLSATDEPTEMTSVTATPTDRAGHPLRWLILGVVLAAEILDVLDGTVVNVATATIHRSLGTSDTALQWIISGYALAMAVGLLVGGRLGDIYGRRRVFLVGIAGFTLASAGSGAAPDTTVLIIARLVQGLAGALMMPQGFGLIRESFPKAELPKVYGLFGPVIGLGAAIGPIIGGGLIAAHLFSAAWRTIFLINVPVGILALGAGYVLLPRRAERQASTLDIGGALLAAVASAALVYPLIQGRAAGWPAWTFISIAVSVVLFAIFGRHIVTTRREPLIVPSMFRRRAYDSGALLIMLAFGGMTGAMLVITLFFQLGEGFSAIHAALTVMPLSLGLIVAAALSAPQAERLGGRILVQGGLVLSLAGYVFAAIFLLHSGHISSWAFIPCTGLLGLGMGMFAPTAFATVTAAVTDAELGSASGTLEAIQQLGSALGCAVLPSVFFGALAQHGFHHALSDALWWGVGSEVLALAVSPLLPREARPESDLEG